MRKNCKKSIHPDNAITIYAIAKKYILDNVLNICVKYAKDNMDKITQSEAFMEIDSEILRDFIKYVSDKGVQTLIL